PRRAERLAWRGAPRRGGRALANGPDGAGRRQGVVEGGRRLKGRDRRLAPQGGRLISRHASSLRPSGPRDRGAHSDRGIPHAGLRGAWIAWGARPRGPRTAGLARRARSP